MRTSSAAVLAGILVVGAARPAIGSPTNPALLQRTLGMPCAPPCTLCHRDMNGGLGTVITPFGKAMIFHGAEATNDDAVVAALTALEGGADGGAPTDSDGDGVGDIAELRAGRNPNVPGDASLCGPTYGCGARVEPKGSLDGFGAFAAALAAVALAAMARRRRR